MKDVVLNLSADSGISPDQLREGRRLDHPNVCRAQAALVPETVAVPKGLELPFENPEEQGTHQAIRDMVFRQPTDPEIDVVYPEIGQGKATLDLRYRFTRATTSRGLNGLHT